jgi:IS605 OrfB family transposase
MKQKLTIVCKLQPTQEQTTQIEAALSGFAPAGNYINNTLNFKQTNNYQQWLNYNICRVTLDRAKSGNLVVAIEKLTSIREHTNHIPRSQTERRRPSSWAFYQLSQFFDRKASQAGLRVVKVNHACTSQTCHKCNHIPLKTGKSYRKVKKLLLRALWLAG